VRGFLPSTGRLIAFRPPAASLQAGAPVPAGTPGVRVDTGVYEGGEIAIHYDSMICKLIACGVDRTAAIATMRDALNGFVIRGVASNLAFQSALLGHPRFAAGDFTTGFIAEEFAQGFDPGAIAHPEREFLLALAAAFERRLLARSIRLTGQLAGHELCIGERFVVVELAADGTRTRDPGRVARRGRRVRRHDRRQNAPDLVHERAREHRCRGSVDGVPFRAQVERVGLGLRVVHYGTRVDVRVLTPRAAELRALMPFKPPPDLSRFLLSPMPGLLVNVAVQPGQAVRAGERLAVIEAMKMENVVVAAQDGVVARIVATPGESLAVDEVILEFAAAAAVAEAK
jgi:propionyl-CoA carboxylase alpha chain